MLRFLNQQQFPPNPAGGTNNQVPAPAPIKQVTPPVPPVNNQVPAPAHIKKVKPPVPPVNNQVPAPARIKQVTPPVPPVNNQVPAPAPIKQVTPPVPPVNNQVPAPAPIKQVTPPVPPVNNQVPAPAPIKQVTPPVPPVNNQVPAPAPIKQVTPPVPPVNNQVPAPAPIKQVTPPVSTKPPTPPAPLVNKVNKPPVSTPSPAAAGNALCDPSNLMSLSLGSVIQGNTQCTVTASIPGVPPRTESGGLDCTGTSCTLSVTTHAGTLSALGVCDGTARTTTICGVVADYTCQCPSANNPGGGTNNQAPAGNGGPSRGGTNNQAPAGNGGPPGGGNGISNPQPAAGSNNPVPAPASNPGGGSVSCDSLLSPYGISVTQGSTQCAISVSIPQLNNVACSQQEGLTCSGTSCTLSASVPIIGAVSTDVICDNTDRTSTIDNITANYKCQCPSASDPGGGASINTIDGTNNPAPTGKGSGIIPPNPSGTSNPSSGIKLVGHQALLILAFMGAMTVLNLS